MGMLAILTSFLCTFLANFPIIHNNYVIYIFFDLTTQRLIV